MFDGISSPLSLCLGPRELNTKHFEAALCGRFSPIFHPEVPRYNQRHEDPADEAQQASPGMLQECSVTRTFPFSSSFLRCNEACRLHVETLTCPQLGDCESGKDAMML